MDDACEREHDHHYDRQHYERADVHPDRCAPLPDETWHLSLHWQAGPGLTSSHISIQFFSPGKTA